MAQQIRNRNKTLKFGISFPIISVLAISIFLTGCSGSNRNIGTATGTIVGGIVGNQFGSGKGKTAAAIIGALAGGVIGRGVGDRIDKRNQQLALNAEYNALENGRSGNPVRWEGNNGIHGEVVPQQTYQVGSQNCRRYSHKVYIDGQPSTAGGTACRNPDGTWSLLN